MEWSDLAQMCAHLGLEVHGRPHSGRDDVVNLVCLPAFLISLFMVF